MVVCATRFFVFILKPLHQPRVIAEILGGLLLGPSIFGRNLKFANAVFPLKSVMVLETMANMGLIYFVFLVGLEMDISIIKRTGKKTVSIAFAGMILPFLIAVCVSHLIEDKDNSMNQASYVLYIGIVLSVTAFPVLARMLADLKLISTDLGKLALSISLINDVFAWILLALAIALSEANTGTWASVLVVISNLVFVSFCFVIVRPAVSWLIERTPEGKPFSEFQLCIVLTGVMISAFITDVLGTHCAFGAFVYGLVIPNGPLGAAILEKLEDFVSGLLLPLFYAICGLKTDIKLISGASTWTFVLTVIPLTCLGKILGTFFISLIFQIPNRDGVVLGLLMNSKGLIEMIVLNVGREQKVLGDKIFSVMVIVTLVMTAVVSPIVTLIYKPRKRLIPYKRRTIQNSRLDAELRVLVCIHTPRNVPTLVNLLEATHPHKRSPICAYVLHLVELTGRASAMLVVHANRQSGGPALNKTQAQTDHIITAFQNFEEHVGHTQVQPLTAISPYSTMHEDICNLAEDKRVVNNGEETVAAIRSINNVNDLFIVGRGQGTMSPLTDGLTDWSECPELGAIGDLLASSDFETTASVLVMHQYVGQGPDGEENFVVERPWQTSEHYHNMKQQQNMQRYTMPMGMGQSLL
ncbi:hypothetical protein JHK82_041571 [Glycine max]|nr:hypothetical protein JHK82_041571 [Glycine max]